MAYTVYILRCRDKSLYTGITNDLAARLRAHQQGTGAAYTRAHKPDRVVYTETKKTRGSALKREYAIKQLSRQEKEALIERSGAVSISPSKAPRPERRPKTGGRAPRA